MNKSSSKAQELALTYGRAMAKKDVESILSISAKDIVCTSPLGQIKGVDNFRGFQEGFAKMIKNLTVLAVHGDDKQAVLVYDVETHPVPHAMVAELISVKDGKIASTDVIYDATPFAAYAASVQPH